MTDTSQKNGGFSRRAVTIGGSIAAALGIAALGLSVPHWLRKHYAKSTYDDLFAQLVDRDAAVRLGQAILDDFAEAGAARQRAGHYIIDPDPLWQKLYPDNLAKTLRARLKNQNLSAVSAADVARGELLEVRGWVLPETVVLLCLLAADENH